MHPSQMMFPIPGGGATTLTFSEPATLESIEAMERLTATVFESLRRAAVVHDAGDPGGLEYASWQRGSDAGAVEFESWKARP